MGQELDGCGVQRGGTLVFTGVTGRKAPVWLLFCLDNFPLRVHSPGAGRIPSIVWQLLPANPREKRPLPGTSPGLSSLAKCRCLEFLSA